MASNGQPHNSPGSLLPGGCALIGSLTIGLAVSWLPMLMLLLATNLPPPLRSWHKAWKCPDPSLKLMFFLAGCAFFVGFGAGVRLFSKKADCRSHLVEQYYSHPKTGQSTNCSVSVNSP